jgi:hypothetical protein
MEEERNRKEGRNGGMGVRNGVDGETDEAAKYNIGRVGWIDMI